MLCRVANRTDRAFVLPIYHLRSSSFETAPASTVQLPGGRPSSLKMPILSLASVGSMPSKVEASTKKIWVGQGRPVTGSMPSQRIWLTMEPLLRFFPLERVVAFSDGVFAVVITILVLGIEVPSDGALDPTAMALAREQ
jgi:hypothetical protein